MKLDNAIFLKGIILTRFLSKTEVSAGIMKLRSNKKTLAYYIRCHLEILWWDEWKASKECRQTKLWLPEGFDVILSSLLMNLSRLRLGYAVQFISGHGWWSRHLYLVKLKDSPNCEACHKDNAIETPEHLFYHCDSFAHARLLYLGSSYEPVFNAEWDRLLAFLFDGKVAEMFALTEQKVNVVP